jgi:2-iminoacetate synthase
MFIPDYEKTQKLLRITEESTKRDIVKAINCEKFGLDEFATTFSPLIDNTTLKLLAGKSALLTRKRFGRAVSLYIPLYYDNRCTNGCVYCGFNCRNEIERTALSFDEIIKEAEIIRKQNFKNILLVAGEHPESADIDFLVPVIRKLHDLDFTCVSIEIAPLEEEQYKTLVKDAHLDGLYVYQETYNRNIYNEVHPSGKKSDYNWRLETAQRAARAGVPKIGIGFLLGLGDFREESFNLAQHLSYLQKHHWQSEYSISFPRIRNAKGMDKNFSSVSDMEFIQLVSSLRLLFNETGMSLSTREIPQFRDAVIPLGFTSLSAGSLTAPGGYSVKKTDNPQLLEQFEVEDSRTPEEIASVLSRHGFDPVWKDWQ